MANNERRWEPPSSKGTLGRFALAATPSNAMRLVQRLSHLRAQPCPMLLSVTFARGGCSRHAAEVTQRQSGGPGRGGSAGGSCRQSRRFQWSNFSMAVPAAALFPAWCTQRAGVPAVMRVAQLPLRTQPGRFHSFTAQRFPLPRPSEQDPASYQRSSCHAALLRALPADGQSRWQRRIISFPTRAVR